MTRALIYARVSQEEQAIRELSIPFQLDSCRRYAEAQHFEVVGTFTDDESARSDRRTNFRRLIAAARAKSVDVILVHKFDRFSRNDADFVLYEKELEQLQCQLRSVCEPFDATTPAGWLARRMLQVMAAYFSKNLATEALKGMAQKARNGGWPARAPLGYRNARREIRAKVFETWIEPDPTLGPKIAQAFADFATGGWTLLTWEAEAFLRGIRTREGNRVRASRWQEIFRNPFYVCRLRWCDIDQVGNWPALVDEATWQQVQEILGERTHRKPNVAHFYLLQGLVYSLDAGSGCTCTYIPAKGKRYYRSSKTVDGSQVYYPCAELDAQVVEWLPEIQIDPNERPQMRKHIQEYLKALTDGEEARRAQQEIQRLEQRRANLIDLATDPANGISRAEFLAKRAEYDAELAHARGRLGGVQLDVKGEADILEAALDLACRLSDMYAKLDEPGRRDLLRLVVAPQGVRVQEGEIVDLWLLEPFEWLLGRSGPNPRPKAKPAENRLSAGSRTVRFGDPKRTVREPAFDPALARALMRRALDARQ